jgi:putative aldouronate transport system substrate-binding protein
MSMLRKRIFLLATFMLISTGMMCWASGSQAPEEAGGTGAVKKTALTYEGQPSGSLPIVTAPLTLKYWVPNQTDAAKIMDDFSGNPMFQALMKMTGITLQFIHPPLKQEQEAFKLMLASGDLPDIVELTYLKADLYPGGPDQAIKDGVFIRLNELVDTYAPNYKKIMKFKPDIEKSLKTDEGNLYAFQMIEKVVQPSYGGPAVRVDWLDDLGIKVPETMDDWYLMLKAFKEKKGASAPMLMEKKGGAGGYYSFISAYGVIADFCRKGQTVMYGPIEPGFRDYLATMHRWYTEGLIDKDFVSHDGYTGPNTLNKIATGQSGAWECGFYHFNTIEKVMEGTSFRLSAVPYPSRTKGQVVTMRQYNENVRGDPTFITSANKHPVESVKLLDFNYSDQGTLLCNYGIEGVDWVMENGKPKYTYAAMNHPSFPAGSIVTSVFCRHEGPFIRDYARTYISYKPNALQAMEIWEGDQSGMIPKTLTLTSEDGPRFYAIMSDIQTYVTEMIPKFIMGIEPIEKFDQFTAQLKKMGIEEAIGIEQAALTRYFKR